MGIKRLLELNFYNKETQQWESGAPETTAVAVETTGGSNVQAELDAVSGKISDAVINAVAELRGGVAAEGNTLDKLHEAISTIQELLSSDDETLDTVQEIVEYIKKHRADIDKIGTNKVDYADIVNALDTVSTVEGKVLDARQGKVLKDALDVLSTSLAVLEEDTADFIKRDDVAGFMSSVASVVSLTAPENPVDGQIWFKPTGVIEV